MTPPTTVDQPGLVIAPPTITYQPGGNPGTFAAQCEVHGHHDWVPKYLEWHHVVPQGWQDGRDAAPPVPDTPHAGKGTEGRWLWDMRGAFLDRSAHGNVHYWVVFIMKEFWKLAQGNQLPAGELLFDALVNTRKADPQYHRAELALGYEAPRRALEAGADLRYLCLKHNWGGIY